MLDTNALYFLFPKGFDVFTATFFKATTLQKATFSSALGGGTSPTHDYS